MNLNKKLLIPAVIAALAFGGCGAKDDKEPATAEVSNALSVEVVTASDGEVETNYVYSGKTTPVETANVFSLVSGIVKDVNFDIGDTVNEGDVLFTMDTEAIENSLRTAQAAYQASLANVDVAQTTLDTVNGASMQMQLENLKNALDSAKMAYDTAKTSYDNTKALYDQGFVSQVDMDAVTDALKNAENSYNQAQSSYDITSGQLIEENTEKAQASLNAAQAQANSAAAQIASAEKSLRDAQVKSPISGVVTGNNVVAGTMLSTSSVPFTVMDTSSVIVKVSVSEQIINSLEIGASVDVKISAVSNNEMEGKIKTINPAANSAGTYDVEIEIPNITGLVKTGMFAEVSFVKEKGYNAIVVPRDAVINKNNENFVFVAENGVAVKRPVVMGIDDGQTVQVLKGVEEGELVIVKGQTYLEEGNEVNIVAKDGQPTEEGADETAAAPENGSESGAGNTAGTESESGGADGLSQPVNNEEGEGTAAQQEPSAGNDNGTVKGE